MNMVNCLLQLRRTDGRIQRGGVHDHSDCKLCGGAKRVPAAWAEAWDETGLESRCDHCHARRPCAIMERTADEIVIVCASCAAVMETASVLQEAAS